MNRITTQFLIATLLALSALKAQAPPSAFTFRPLVQPGMTIGNHTFTGDTEIDGVALNDSGEIAFIARWSDPGSGQEHSAVFTSRRLIAQDRETVDGKALTTIVKDSVAINNAGQCAYEADYVFEYSDANNGLSRRGVFVDQSLALTLKGNETGAGPDFTLTEDGKVIPRAVPSSPAHASSSTAAPPSSPGSGLPNGVHVNTSKILGRILNNPKSPISIDPNILTQPGQRKPQQGPPPTAAQPPASCAMPKFPFPIEWDMGAQMGGPTASQTFDPPAAGRVFDSPYYGHLNAPFRAIQFDADCHPLVIAIGDSSSRGRFEVYTPVGTLTYRNPDGSYQFRGFSGNVESASFVKTDAMLRINRKGQVLIPVTLTPNGYALLLGTPSTH